MNPPDLVAPVETLSNLVLSAAKNTLLDIPLVILSASIAAPLEIYALTIEILLTFEAQSAPTVAPASTPLNLVFSSVVYAMVINSQSPVPTADAE